MRTSTRSWASRDSEHNTSQAVCPYLTSKRNGPVQPVVRSAQGGQATQYCVQRLAQDP